MSIEFDLSTTSQSTIFFADIKVNAYEKLINFSKKHTHAARFIGLPIALCSSLLNLAATVSTIGESLIKGIANIFGSPFSKKCHFLKGIKQIFLQAPLHLLVNAIMVPLAAAHETLVMPIKILIAPTQSLISKKEDIKILKKDVKYLSKKGYKLSPRGSNNILTLLMKNMYS